MLPLQTFRTGSGSRVPAKMAASATRKDVCVVLATAAQGASCEFIKFIRTLQVNQHHRHHRQQQQQQQQQ